MEEQPVPAPPEVPDIPPAPIMDVKAPPPAAEAARQPAKPNEPAKAPSKPKPQAKGVATAIIATVIIVLGLAALTVYAYIKTK